MDRAKPSYAAPARRVGILTLPLGINYGGILQAAALYRFLEDSGFEPVFLNRKPAKNKLKVLIGSLLRQIPFIDIKGLRAAERRRSVHYPFLDQAMPKRTRYLRTVDELRQAAVREGLDAVVVGSDQVWRPEYHYDNEPLAYFLNFVDPAKARRIAYSASFGTSEWRRPELNVDIAGLLQDFRAISVREESGIAICAGSFGATDVVCVADPAMLVDASFYEDIAQDPARTGGTFLEYILDVELIGQGVLDHLAATLSGVGAVTSLRPYDGRPDITVPQWVGEFRNAEYVITDSFHGTLVSVLHERNFVTVLNRKRGADRLEQLLGPLGLENRIVTRVCEMEISDKFAQPIDYAPVRQRVAELRSRSAAFLLDALRA
jgi:hypothetical protein